MWIMFQQLVCQQVAFNSDILIRKCTPRLNGNTGVCARADQAGFLMGVTLRRLERLGL